jgi:hypothetical protein
VTYQQNQKAKLQIQQDEEEMNEGEQNQAQDVALDTLSPMEGILYSFHRILDVNQFFNFLYRRPSYRDAH